MAKTTTINGHPLSADVVLTAEDVGGVSGGHTEAGITEVVKKTMTSVDSSNFGIGSISLVALYDTIHNPVGTRPALPRGPIQGSQLVSCSFSVLDITEFWPGLVRPPGMPPTSVDTIYYYKRGSVNVLNGALPGTWFVHGNTQTSTNDAGVSVDGVMVAFATRIA